MRVRALRYPFKVSLLPTVRFELRVYPLRSPACTPLIFLDGLLICLHWVHVLDWRLTRGSCLIRVERIRQRRTLPGKMATLEVEKLALLLGHNPSPSGYRLRLGLGQE